MKELFNKSFSFSLNLMTPKIYEIVLIIYKYSLGILNIISKKFFFSNVLYESMQLITNKVVSK